MKKFIYLFVYLSIFINVGRAQITEGFESGLPGSYTTGTAVLSSGTWSLTNGIKGSTVHGGSASLQLKSQAGANAITPNITCGVGTVTFWAEGTASPNGVQVNYSTDGGSTWTAATGSPFAPATGSFTQYTATINSSAANILIQFYRTAGTISIDDVVMTCFSSACSPPTTKASVVTFSGVSTTGLTTSWTGGNGYGDVVVISTSNITPSATGGTTYNANTVYGSGDLMGAGYYTVYNGTGTSVAITGLTCNTTYYIYVFEYNNTGTSAPCFTTSATSNTITSACPSSIPTCTTITTSGTGNFTVPAGATSMTVSLWGGGGGGGGSYGSSSLGKGTGAGGGGGGASSTNVITVSAGQVYSYTVGVGGSGGAAGSAKPGTVGGTTTFTGTAGTYSAVGGGSGGGVTTTDGSTGTGGTGGATGTGTVKAGGSAGNGYGGSSSLYAVGGGGGGGASTSNNGSAGTSGASSSPSGDGGAGGTGTNTGGNGGNGGNYDHSVEASSAGSNGSAPGGGGGGGSSGGISKSGGKGGDGQITLCYNVASAAGITTGNLSTDTVNSCTDSTILVAYTSTGTFASGNVFTAQLSDASGSFTSPTNIGTLTSTATSGTISITIPANTITGANYQVRVVSSNTTYTGSASPIILSVLYNCDNTNCDGQDTTVIAYFDNNSNAGLWGAGTGLSGTLAESGNNSTPTGTATGSNAFFPDATPGNAYAISNSSGTSNHFDFHIQASASGLCPFACYKLYVQAKTFAGGATTMTLKYSTDNVTFTTFPQTYTVGTSWNEYIWNLTNITAINNATNLYFQIWLSGATGTGAFDIDNFQLQGVGNINITLPNYSFDVSCSNTVTATATFSVACSTSSAFNVMLLNTNGTAVSGITNPIGTVNINNASSGSVTFTLSPTITQGNYEIEIVQAATSFTSQPIPIYIVNTCGTSTYLPQLTGIVTDACDKKLCDCGEGSAEITLLSSGSYTIDPTKLGTKSIQYWGSAAAISGTPNGNSYSGSFSANTATTISLNTPTTAQCGSGSFIDAITGSGHNNIPPAATIMMVPYNFCASGYNLSAICTAFSPIYVLYFGTSNTGASDGIWSDNHGSKCDAASGNYGNHASGIAYVGITFPMAALSPTPSPTFGTQYYTYNKASEYNGNGASEAWSGTPGTTTATALPANTYTPTGSGTADFCSLPVVLPVQFLSFTAAKTQQNIMLNWATAAEINNNYFEVQYSLDGQNFTSFTQVKSAENAQRRNEYTCPFTINIGENTPYFRLKQVDINGKYQYSNVITLDGNPSNTSNSLIVYYNIDNDKIISKFKLDYPQQVSISLYNISGQEVYSNNTFFNEGFNQFLIDAPDKAGIYLLVYQAGDSAPIHKKIMISK